MSPRNLRNRRMHSNQYYSRPQGRWWSSWCLKSMMRASILNTEWQLNKQMRWTHLSPEPNFNSLILHCHARRLKTLLSQSSSNGRQDRSNFVVLVRRKLFLSNFLLDSKTRLGHRGEINWDLITMYCLIIRLLIGSERYPKQKKRNEKYQQTWERMVRIAKGSISRLDEIWCEI